MSGLTTTGLTNHPTGGDSVLHAQLSAEPVLDTDFDTGATERAAVEPAVDPNAESWRAEVAAHLERYRTRRKPRTPRYPSLLLPFDSPESWFRSTAATGTGTVATATLRVQQDIEAAIE